MSEIRANTISDAAGTGPITLTKQSAAKVVVTLNASGTIAGSASLNVSSGTDNGTGFYSANLTNSFSADNNGIPVGCPRSTDDVAGPTYMASASEINIKVVDISAHAFEDKTTNLIAHGDLA